MNCYEGKCKCDCEGICLVDNLGCDMIGGNNERHCRQDRNESLCGFSSDSCFMDNPMRMATEKRLIDANALTDLLNHTTMVAYPNLFPGLLAAVEIVDDSPTVDAVEVVHGRWINPYINRYGHPCHCCSECGFKASYQDKNYCPNCGAKMDGDDALLITGKCKSCKQHKKYGCLCPEDWCRYWDPEEGCVHKKEERDAED